VANYNLKRIERDIEKYLPVIIQRETTDELLKQSQLPGVNLLMI